MSTHEPQVDPGFDPTIGARTASKGQRSLGSLLGELTTETRVLVQQEIELARTEVSEKLALLQRSSIFMALGGAFALAALLTLVTALATGLTALLAQVVSLDVAVWLGPLILAAILGGVAYALIQQGLEKLKKEKLTLDRTAESLRDDSRWIKEKVS